MSDLYLIWSNEHRRWWAPGESGYVSSVSHAGRYNRNRALAICHNALGTSLRIGILAEIPVREDDVLEFLKTAPFLPAGIA